MYTTYIRYKAIYKLYTVYILLNNKSLIKSLEAQSILLISCQRLETFSPSGAFRNRTNKLFKLITSDWFDFLQKLMSWWYTYAISCSCIFLLGTCNYCCFIIAMVLAAKQAWQKMVWSYENTENNQIMWKSQVILSGARCCITLDPFFIVQSGTKIINIWSICVYFNDMYHSTFLVWNR